MSWSYVSAMLVASLGVSCVQPDDILLSYNGLKGFLEAFIPNNDKRNSDPKYPKISVSLTDLNIEVDDSTGSHQLFNTQTRTTAPYNSEQLRWFNVGSERHDTQQQRGRDLIPSYVDTGPINLFGSEVRQVGNANPDEKPNVITATVLDYNNNYNTLRTFNSSGTDHFESNLKEDKEGNTYPDGNPNVVGSTGLYNNTVNTLNSSGMNYWGSRVYQIGNDYGNVLSSQTPIMLPNTSTSNGHTGSSAVHAWQDGIQKAQTDKIQSLGLNKENMALNIKHNTDLKDRKNSGSIEDTEVHDYSEGYRLSNMEIPTSSATTSCNPVQDLQTPEEVQYEVETQVNSPEVNEPTLEIEDRGTSITITNNNGLRCVEQRHGINSMTSCEPVNGQIRVTSNEYLFLRSFVLLILHLIWKK